MYYKDINLISWDKIDIQVKEIFFSEIGNELHSLLQYNWMLDCVCVPQDVFDKKNLLFSILKEHKVFNIEDSLERFWINDKNKHEFFIQTILSWKKRKLMLNIRDVSKNKTVLNNSLKEDYILWTWNCLFGNGWVIACLDNGEKINFMDSKVSHRLNWQIVDFNADKFFTIYEYESLVRNLFLIKHIVSQGSINEIRVSMPKIAYWFYWIDLFSKWLCSRDALIKYIGLISERVEKINNIFTKRFSVPVKVYTPLAELEEYLQWIIDDDKSVSIFDVKDILSGSNNIRKSVLKIKEDLNLYEIFWWRSEAVEDIKTSLDNDWKMWILVKNPKESYSLSLCNDVIRKFSRESWADYALLGVFPSELINVNGRKSLYNIPWNNSLSVKKQFIY